MDYANQPNKPEDMDSRFDRWWKRNAEDFVYTDPRDASILRYTAYRAYCAGHRAAKRVAPRRLPSAPNVRYHGTPHL